LPARWYQRAVPCHYETSFARKMLELGIREENFRQ
jgi:hypothetical protein